MKRPRTKSAFLETDEGQEAQELLRELVASRDYQTLPGYSPNKALYPGGIVPFEDKHINYLLSYPNLQVDQYIANLKVRIKIIK